MTYQYVAYNEDGVITKGRLSASSEEIAAEMLGYAGYRVISLKSVVKIFALDELFSRFSRVKSNEIILFYRQLALLLEAGINIIGALEMLWEKASNHTLKRILNEVITDLRNGNQLSTALSRHPTVFNPIYCRLVNIGEQTGNLEEVLRQVANYIKREADVNKSMTSALMYPLITSVVAIAVISILVIYVVPAFSVLYDSLGANLPLMTRIVLDAASQLRAYGAYLLFGIILISSLTIAYSRTADGRFFIDRLILRLPLLGRVFHIKELARCCRNIYLLFRAGLPLTEIMNLVIQGCKNRAIVKALTEVHQDMLKGEGLSQPMTKHPLFLPMMIQMVRVGEETGNLDNAVLAVAESYESEAEDKTNAIIGMIQPAMMIIIAVLVGGIVLSLVSAMYSIYGQIA